MSLWSVYKSKVLQTFSTEQDGEMHEESDTSEIIENENRDNEDDGLNVSQLARKVQGAIGWKNVSSLFFKENEQGPDQVAEQRPEQASEQSPSSRSQENPSEKRSAAFWNVFTNKWQQRSGERSEAKGVLSDPPSRQNEMDHAEETPFRWNFLTNKIAELRSKTD